MSPRHPRGKMLPERPLRAILNAGQYGLPYAAMRFFMDSPEPLDANLRQSYGTPKLARRHVDQHQVHRPLPQPVLGHRLLPAIQRQFFPVERAYPRPLDCDLASMEADLARRAPPAMTAPVLAARMPWPTGHLGVRFHHRAPASRARPPGRTGRRTQTLLPTPYPQALSALHSSSW